MWATGSLTDMTINQGASPLGQLHHSEASSRMSLPSKNEKELIQSESSERAMQEGYLKTEECKDEGLM